MCLLAGCSALPAVTVVPHGGATSLRQTFDQAFVTRDGTSGEDQVVLVNAPIVRRTSDGPGKVIEPLADVPLHTVMTVRLHWRVKTSILRTSAGLNAVLHWYVYGSPAGGGPPSLLHYVGTGLVRLSDGGDGADVDVSHGSLHLAERFGDLRDPLGSFTVDGSFHAVASDRQVAETLADVKGAVDQASLAFPPPSTRP